LLIDLKDMVELNGTSITHTIDTRGILFDIDGTLMMSTQCVEQGWIEWGQENGFDGYEILKTSHGRRTIDILKQIKPEFATEEYCGSFEQTIPQKWSHLAIPIPGVFDLLHSLPESQWGVVTSGTSQLAFGWFDHFLKIPHPKIFITAEMVELGKPNPMGYKLGAKLLDLGDNFLVFEDAPAGIRAGKDAGATVIGLATTYTADVVKQAGADIVIKDLNSVKVIGYDEGNKLLSLTFEDCIY
jgi:glycerol-1-phosphatase